MSRSCVDCAKPITAQNKSGRCRGCLCRWMSSDPEVNARRLARLAEVSGLPETRARTSAALRAYCRSPEARAVRRANGLRNWRSTLGTDACRAKVQSPEVIARRARTYSNNVMAWCPPEYRDEYRALFKKHHGMTRERAKQTILDRIAAKKAAMSPFERQMDALMRGGRLVEKPVLRKPDYAYTLAGVVGELG